MNIKKKRNLETIRHINSQLLLFSHNANNFLHKRPARHLHHFRGHFIQLLPIPGDLPFPMNPDVNQTVTQQMRHPFLSGGVPAPRATLDEGNTKYLLSARTSISTRLTEFGVWTGSGEGIADHGGLPIAEIFLGA
jgi:hypothetical protein